MSQAQFKGLATVADFSKETSQIVKESQDGLVSAVKVLNTQIAETQDKPLANQANAFINSTNQFVEKVLKDEFIATLHKTANVSLSMANSSADWKGNQDAAETAVGALASVSAELEGNKAPEVDMPTSEVASDYTVEQLQAIMGTLREVVSTRFEMMAKIATKWRNEVEGNVSSAWQNGLEGSLAKLEKYSNQLRDTWKEMEDVMKLQSQNLEDFQTAFLKIQSNFDSSVNFGSDNVEAETSKVSAVDTSAFS